MGYNDGQNYTFNLERKTSRINSFGRMSLFLWVVLENLESLIYGAKKFAWQCIKLLLIFQKYYLVIIKENS